ncbi:MAG: ribokinase [Ilumatobacter sp.]
MSEFDVVVIGSLNMDIVARTPRLPGPGETLSGTSYSEFPGGKGLNQAVSAARCGARVALIGAVGDDAAGASLRRVLQDEGIEDRHVLTHDGAATGRAIIAVDDQAENSIIVIPGANSLLRFDTLASAPLLLAQLEVPTSAIEAAFIAAQSQEMRTLLNPAPAASMSASLLECCNVVVPNEHEVELIGGVDGLLDAGVDDVIVTRGAAGAEHHRLGHHTHSVPAFPVDPVDTTGAGDALCGALAARLASGDDMATSLRFAAAAGALATTTPGAVPSLPTMAQIMRLIGSHP